MYAKGKGAVVPSDSQAREKLALYVYEYLLHVGAQKSAQTFLSEIRWEKNITLGEPPGFLHSWWCVFWDLYCAAPDRRETCEHSSEAKAFHDYVSHLLLILCFLLHCTPAPPPLLYPFLSLSPPFFLSLPLSLSQFPMGPGPDGPMGGMGPMEPHHMNGSLGSGDMDGLPKNSPNNMGGMNNPPGTPRDDGEMGGNFLNPFQSESYSPNMTMSV
ncbi:single-stranded DNA-binding protein 2 [Alosa sapidissima]|uniref:single-stranded DNA-binding protein 2 n=1 Tax=Alosa sapidissima TaxID=34773 RepID=UPI001C09E40D|nr:single-stranded DNA-binding protein 2 [Alosa sapidissima]